jgi:(E)-4-hydroxy-3-methylbut-2-enyl-diphosphate synthase
VTEAGAGEDGIVKSACGIGPLLAEGIGDTIRVSLTGAPESEMPAALQLVEMYQYTKTRPDPAFDEIMLSTGARSSLKPNIITEWDAVQNSLDLLFSVTGVRDPVGLEGGVMVPVAQWNDEVINTFPYFSSVKEYCESKKISKTRNYILVDHLGCEQLKSLTDQAEQLILVIDAAADSARSLVNDLMSIKAPWMLAIKVHADPSVSINASILWAGRISEFLNCGRMQLIWCSGGGNHYEAYQTSLSILQSHGLRRSKAEFVSCPSCGRTEFDIESLLETIKLATSHLTHLKIAVMGCIVNGPGEMADADYGCIGMGKGEVALYKHGAQIKTHVPEKEAAAALCEMIRAYGDRKTQAGS